jgi:hypothetical protein
VRRFVPTPVVVAIPFLVMAGRLMLAHRDPVLSGDHALLDLGVLDATRLRGSLGPYSRYGFFHPGPALFYLLAPVAWATGRAPWALHFGVQLLYAVTAAAAVALVGRRAGPAAGAGAAVVVLAWTALLRPGVLAVPWNPLVIILPASLLLVSTAAVRGLGPPLGVVLLAGTFLIQTHVGTGLLVAVCGAVAVGLAVVRRQRQIRGARRWCIALLALAGVLWLPPAIEQVTHEPGNAGRLVRFFLERHGSAATPMEAAALVGREVDVSRASIPYLGTPTPRGVGRDRSLAAIGVFAILAVALAVLGHRAGEDFAARLGVVSLLAVAAGDVSVTRIVGETYWYLLAWTSASVVPLATGWVVLATRRLPATPAVLVAGLASLALTAAVVAMPLYDSPAFPEEARYRAGVREVWAVVDPLVRTTKVDSVAFQTTSEAPSPAIAGVAVRLERRGVHTAVSSNLVHIYGARHRAGGREALRIAFLERGTPPPPGATPLGPAAGFDLYVLR